MEQWYYTTGYDGDTEKNIPALAGAIVTRLYRSGLEYRPSVNPRGKEFAVDGLGKFSFSIPFDGDEPLDIPYELLNDSA